MRTFERRGTPIGPNDLLIAAHARWLNATLVTSNIGELSRVAELRLEDWRR
jgi:tRNA(fMet)-specific endonuclease VapC